MLKILDRLTKLDPFGGPDEEGIETMLDTGVRVFLTKKVRHVFSENDRVVVHAPQHYHDGSPGKITDARDDRRLRVKLDSGSEVHASAEDLIPEELAPAAESVKILKRALDSGAVSIHDRVQIETCLEKVRIGNYAMSPFGETLCDSPVRNLEIYAEKYQASDTSNVLSKRAGGSDQFSIGQLVKEKMTGKKGKITRLDVTHAEIDFGNGTTGTYLLGYFEAA